MAAGVAGTTASAPAAKGVLLAALLLAYAPAGEAGE
jgi:hypothetical protein